MVVCKTYFLCLQAVSPWSVLRSVSYQYRVSVEAAALRYSLSAFWGQGFGVALDRRYCVAHLCHVAAVNPTSIHTHTHTHTHTHAHSIDVNRSGEATQRANVGRDRGAANTHVQSRTRAGGTGACAAGATVCAGQRSPPPDCRRYATRSELIGHCC